MSRSRELALTNSRGMTPGDPYTVRKMERVERLDQSTGEEIRT